MVDTNVLISAALSPHGLPRQVLEWIIEYGQMVLSASAFDEFSTRFISRQKFDRYLSLEARRAFVAVIASAAEAVKVTTSVEVCSDPDDNQFVELAIDGRADYIVTGNTKDFPESYEGIQVVTPRAFAVAAGFASEKPKR